MSYFVKLKMKLYICKIICSKQLYQVRQALRLTRREIRTRPERIPGDDGHWGTSALQWGEFSVQSDTHKEQGQSLIQIATWILFLHYQIAKYLHSGILHKNDQMIDRIFRSQAANPELPPSSFE
uniref:Uncharacterized protein n=1 Tax=Micrurus surinamensis TaxID=129470 RepID=A0A2D4P7I5_MICSU